MQLRGYFSKSSSAGPLFLWIRIKKDERFEKARLHMIIRCMAHITVIFCVHLCGFRHTNIFREGTSFMRGGPAAASGEWYTFSLPSHYVCAANVRTFSQKLHVCVAAGRIRWNPIAGIEWFLSFHSCMGIERSAVSILQKKLAFTLEEVLGASYCAVIHN